MGNKRKIEVLQPAADNIADIAWFIESKGLIETAEKFSDSAYDYFEKIADKRRIHRKCKDITRAELGFKCITFKRKYTVVFIESKEEIIICEFLPSSLIK